MIGEIGVNRLGTAIAYREAADVVVASGPIIETVSDTRWDGFVAASPHGHLMQSSRWGALKARFGWEVERLILMDGDTIVAGAQILYRSLPLKLARLAYVPMGPVVDWENEEQVNALLEALQRTVRRRGAFCLKLEPAIPESPDRVALLVSHGFRPSPQTVQWRSTVLADLGCTEDEVFARFNPEHRRRVRKAAREGIVVRPGTTADLPGFQMLLEETARRKEFAIFPADYYHAAYDLFAAERRVELFLATYQDTILAGIMVFALGRKAYCLYAASSNTHRELAPTYALYWAGIRWAYAKGCTIYDACGIPDEVGKDPERYAREARNEALWGVYQFKRGFCKQVVCYTDTYDQIYSRWLYSLYNQAIDLLKYRLGDTWHRKFFSG